ncbi:MAG: serine protease [Pedobacter sp.]|nr:MAG: serine protease [Pedobacter sp.]
MRNEIELEAIIEDYLNGKLTADEHKAFEQLRNNDPIVDHKVVAHKVFLESMKQYADVLLLKQQLDAAHDKIDVAAISAKVGPHPSKIVRIFRNNKSAIAVAASFLILAMIMLYSIQSQKDVGLQQVKRDVNDIKNAQDIFVYTLGYPKDDVVLGDGYVSSKTGLNGDTVAYQVAIPVNPGNSGGPLLDNSGNVVGVINGKETKTDGAAFAVKSKYIMEALNAIPQDSLSRRVAYGKRSSLLGLKRNQQVQKIQDYVFMIKVY